MNQEQKFAIIYSLMGIAAGIVSKFLGNLLYLAILLPIVIYVVSFIFLRRNSENKKLSWLLSNSLVPFLLVWLTVWIMLFNLL